MKKLLYVLAISLIGLFIWQIIVLSSELTAFRKKAQFTQQHCNKLIEITEHQSTLLKSDSMHLDNEVGAKAIKEMCYFCMLNGIKRPSDLEDEQYLQLQNQINENLANWNSIYGQYQRSDSASRIRMKEKMKPILSDLDSNFKQILVMRKQNLAPRKKVKK